MFNKTDYIIQKIIDSSTDMIFVKDRELRTVFCNSAYAGAIGKKPSEMYGKTDLENGWLPELVKGDPSKGTRGFEQDDKDALSGKTIHNPNDPENVGGDIHIFDTVKSPLRDPEGNIIGVIGIARDITLRRQTEVEIRNEQAFRESTLNAIADIFYAFDKSGRFLAWNETLKKVTGYSDAELHAMEAIDFFAGEDLMRFSAAIERIWKYGAAREEGHLTLKDKTRIPYEFSGAVLKDGDGNVIGFSGVGRDLTERKRTEMELQKSKALLDTVIEAMPLMIFLKEAEDLRFVIFNRAGEELLGHDRKDLIGKNDLDLFPPEEAANFMTKDREVLGGREGVLDIPEEPITTVKKGVRWLHTRKACIRGDDGAAKYLLGISEDITERKTIEGAFKFMAMASVEYSGVQFFKELARYLADTLHMEYVCIDRLQEGSLVAETVAVYSDGKFEDNVSYALKDTPCGDVFDKRVCCFEKGVSALFPDGTALQALKAESYVGTLLHGASGKKIGLIAVIGRAPAENMELARTILEMVAGRAASEMERQQEVKDRENRVRELEVLGRAGIDRELKMVELKKLNKELQEKVARLEGKR